MTALIRLGRFNLVGAMGIVVQLAALALFNRWMSGRYLYASAAAIEITLLHNFVWHWHYTWRDRRDGATPVRRFVRFHLSSGLISLLGNLALMQLLVHEAHLPLLVSNLVAIPCCSMANFCLGNNWAFARVRKTDPPRESKIAGDPCGAGLSKPTSFACSRMIDQPAFSLEAISPNATVNSTKDDASVDPAARTCRDHRIPRVRLSFGPVRIR
jgi:putative flippase GtrA